MWESTWLSGFTWDGSFRSLSISKTSLRTKKSGSTSSEGMLMMWFGTISLVSWLSCQGLCLCGALCYVLAAKLSSRRWLLKIHRTSLKTNGWDLKESSCGLPTLNSTPLDTVASTEESFKSATKSIWALTGNEHSQVLQLWLQTTDHGSTLLLESDISALALLPL